jgi:hypothetical protein
MLEDYFIFIGPFIDTPFIDTLSTTSQISIIFAYTIIH